MTITYTDGANGTVFKDDVHTVEVGDTTPGFSGTLVRDGYTFAGWSPEVASTATADATYTATWKASDTTDGYAVVVYMDGNGTATLSKTNERSASYAKDETVTLTCQANDGYVIGSVQAYDKTTGEQVKFDTLNSKADVSSDRKSATATFTMPAEDLKLVVQFMTTAEAAASGLTTDSTTSGATSANTDILGNVQTGDESHPAVYAGIAAGAAAVIIALFAGLRKKKNKGAKGDQADTDKKDE